jgi:hypothetical protein
VQLGTVDSPVSDFFLIITLTSEYLCLLVACWTFPNMMITQMNTPYSVFPLVDISPSFQAQTKVNLRRGPRASLSRADSHNPLLTCMSMYISSTLCGWQYTVGRKLLLSPSPSALLGLGQRGLSKRAVPDMSDHP